MSEMIKANPQVKITCKRISQRISIESVDRKFVDTFKNLLDRYELNVQILANYDGEVDESGYADFDEYMAWKETHPNVISKQSIDNIFRKIKNKSRLDYQIDTIRGTVFNVGFVEQNTFELPIIGVELYSGYGSISCCNIMYYDNEISADFDYKEI